MRIAQIAPLINRIPPKKYGGTERVIYALCEELVKRGHKVTLFASGDSQTSADLFSVYPRSLREAKLKDVYGPNPWRMLNIGLAYKMQDEFDIIHDHHIDISLPTANLSKIPVVMTLHGAFDSSRRKLYESLNNVNFIAISKAQVLSAPRLNYVGMVYNGLDMKAYPFKEKSGGYLLFVGRISMEKGVHYAIETAQFLNIPLIIAAKLENEETDIMYYREFIEPKLSEQIKWVGEVDETERNRLMSDALCFLHPAPWREPFGLTLIEAMACGCPVVAFNRGSIPEIIKNGKTGYVVEDVDNMIEAVSNIKNIDREYCRRYVLRKFSAKTMADKYEEIYYNVLKQEKDKRRSLRPERKAIYAHDIKLKKRLN